MIRRSAPAWIALLLVLLGATTASADFSVCNQTLDVVNVAIGQQHGEVFRTEGWWTIGSNQCANVIREELRTRYVYVYATDVFGQTLLDGTEAMCIDEEKFTIDTPGADMAAKAPGCWTRGYREAQFYEVDTKAQGDWRLFLSDPPEANP